MVLSSKDGGRFLLEGVDGEAAPSFSVYVCRLILLREGMNLSPKPERFRGVSGEWLWLWVSLCDIYLSLFCYRVGWRDERGEGRTIRIKVDCLMRNKDLGERSELSIAGIEMRCMLVGALCRSCGCILERRIKWREM